MNDGGGGESSSGIESRLKKRRKNDEFAQSIARIAVAQVCESVGLQGFQWSALDTLSDIACKYIRDIGKLSNFNANLAGRTESNVFDIVHGLEDLGISQWFVGASDIDQILSTSGVIKEISQYVGMSEELGFGYSVPPFPVVKERNSTFSFFQAGVTPPSDIIPPWLPLLPDPNIEKTRMRQDRVNQDRMVNGPSLLKLEQRLVCNYGGRGQGDNPFVAAPLQSREKDVSLVSLPARLVEEDVAQNRSLWADHVSSLGTFAPLIQGFKSSDLETEEGSHKILLERRPAVQLKFHAGKKSLTTASRNNKIGDTEAESWFLNDDLRDDKGGNEKIVKAMMENGDRNGVIQL